MPSPVGCLMVCRVTCDHVADELNLWLVHFALRRRTRPRTRCTRSSRCSPRTRRWSDGCASPLRTGAATRMARPSSSASRGCCTCSARRSPPLTPAPTAASPCHAAPPKTASPSGLQPAAAVSGAGRQGFARHRVEVPPHLSRPAVQAPSNHRMECVCQQEACLRGHCTVSVGRRWGD
ncbi:hypothetical protein VPH35_072725 [Triticum aestivum]